jgi:hypothetical protein
MIKEKLDRLIIKVRHIDESAANWMIENYERINDVEELGSAFYWDGTPQGNEFWDDLRNQLDVRETDNGKPYPIQFTSEEGGKLQKWADYLREVDFEEIHKYLNWVSEKMEGYPRFNCHKYAYDRPTGVTIHSVILSNGQRWDIVNGWNAKRVQVSTPEEAVEALDRSLYQFKVGDLVTFVEAPGVAPKSIIGETVEILKVDYSDETFMFSWRHVREEWAVFSRARLAKIQTFPVLESFNNPLAALRGVLPDVYGKAEHNAYIGKQLTDELEDALQSEVEVSLRLDEFFEDHLCEDDRGTIEHDQLPPNWREREMKKYA